jgi:hypothetical protein
LAILSQSARNTVEQLETSVARAAFAQRLATGLIAVEAAGRKIAADMGDPKSKVAQRKHDLDVKGAVNYSRLLDEDASFAIDYAIASIEQAKVAVLDAIAGHLEVEKAKRTAA